MPTLQPSPSLCYKLKLPELPLEFRAKNVDDTVKRRYTLDCRTGAASETCRSSILVHGGLTMPLNLNHTTISEIQNELILYFAKKKQSGAAFKNLQDWISKELFSLDLITRTWNRIPTLPHNKNEVLGERLLHSMCYYKDSMYIFGGLTVSPQNGYELIATNELWRLDLQTKEWHLIGKDAQITRRFNHTMLIQNQSDETKDTKLVIIGGLNNMDQSISYIDVFNITTGTWESIKSSNRIITNIEGSMVSLSQNKNCPVLLQDNEAEIPTLAFYMSSGQQDRQLNRHPRQGNKDGFISASDSDSYDGDATDGENDKAEDPLGDSNSTIDKNDTPKKKQSIPPYKPAPKTGSSIIALPLYSNAQGVHLISNQDNTFNDI